MSKKAPRFPAFLTLLAAAGLALVPAAALAGARAEVRIAAEHAGFAAAAGRLRDVHLHLHHVINCLAGPRGHGFDAAAGDPCKGRGHGALRDLTGHPTERRLLTQAYRLARVGVHIERFAPAHDVAAAVKDLLGHAAARP